MNLTQFEFANVAHNKVLMMDADKNNSLGPVQLTSNELTEQLAAIPNWNLQTIDIPNKANAKGTELVRKYTFSSFADAIQFMSKAAPYIDQLNHHPKWENEWVNLIVHLTTHDLGYCISNLDITLAKFLDDLYSNYFL